MDLTGIDRLSISSFNSLVVKKLTKNEEADVESCGRFSVGKCYQVCLPKHFIFSIRLLFMKKTRNSLHPKSFYPHNLNAL